MTFAQLITLINTYIVANGNNEITAEVLNPILRELAEFTNDKIGNLGSLSTPDQTNIVNAINSLKLAFDNLNNNGIQLLSGYENPNDVPPPAYNYADFYMELDINDDTPIQLWQWSGTEWNTYSNVYSKSEIDLLLSNIISIPKTQFTANGATSSYDIGVNSIIKAVFWNGALLNDNDFSQLGSILTLTFTPAAGDIIKPI